MPEKGILPVGTRPSSQDNGKSGGFRKHRVSQGLADHRDHGSDTFTNQRRTWSWTFSNKHVRYPGSECHLNALAEVAVHQDPLCLPHLVSPIASVECQVHSRCLIHVYWTKLQTQNWRAGSVPLNAGQQPEKTAPPLSEGPWLLVTFL